MELIHFYCSRTNGRKPRHLAALACQQHRYQELAGFASRPAVSNHLTMLPTQFRKKVVNKQEKKNSETALSLSIHQAHVAS